jgi:hydroxymethylpyrimidine/phosphomethylpyrimidine kinase
MIPVVLTIAGSDSSGGAGIQADLKTFERFGVFGTSAVTLLTAQNTCGVTQISFVDPAMVRAQIDAVVGDMPVAVTKVGALGEVAIIEAVAEAVRAHGLGPLVVDPVMISKHGHPLMGPDAASSLREALLPLATVMTPNLHEAAALWGHPVRDAAEMEGAARALGEESGAAVLVTGGSLDDARALDVLWMAGEVHRFEDPRLSTRALHGTGCSLASALAALIAIGVPLPEAVLRARAWLRAAMEQAPALGRGPVGPLLHRAVPPRLAE